MKVSVSIIIGIGLLIANVAGAQNATDDQSPDADLLPYYQANFVNAQTWSWGTSGVATARGAAALHANPAALVNDQLFDLRVEGGFFRTGYQASPAAAPLNFNFSDFEPHLVSVVLCNNEKFAVGFGYWRPRGVKYVQQAPLYVGGLMETEVTQPRLELGVALRLNPVAIIGVGLVHDSRDSRTKFLNPDQPVQSFFGASPSEKRIRFGLDLEYGGIRMGSTLLTTVAEDHYVASPDVTGGETGNSTVQSLGSYPPEYAAAISYKDLIAIEMRELSGNHSSIVDNYDDDLLEFGGGFRIPTARLSGLPNSSLNFGFFRRTGGAITQHGIDQLYLTGGIQFTVRNLRVVATIINGHWFNDDPEKHSELILGAGYSISSR